MADGARAMIAYKESLRDSVYDNLRVKLNLNHGPTTRSIVPPDKNPPQYDVPEHFDRTETVETNLRYELDYSYGPLLKTKWGQLAPFNNFRADGSPTGCVATSIGQIMAYYKHPIQMSLHNAIWNIESNYLWDQYSNYTNGWSPEAAANVSQLMSDIGQLVFMEYHPYPEGSSAKSKRYAQGAFQFLGYNCNDRRCTDITSSIRFRDSRGKSGFDERG